jgi:hypothetical protein
MKKLHAHCVVLFFLALERECNMGIFTPFGYFRSPFHARPDRVASPQTRRKKRRHIANVETNTDMLPDMQSLIVALQFMSEVVEWLPFGPVHSMQHR